MNGFREVPVDAGIEGIGPCLFVGDAGESADVGRWEVVPVLVFADLGRRLEPVHDGHVHVHEDQEVFAWVFFELVERLEAVFGGVVGQASFLHESYE